MLRPVRESFFTAPDFLPEDGPRNAQLALNRVFAQLHSRFPSAGAAQHIAFTSESTAGAPASPASNQSALQQMVNALSTAAGVAPVSVTLDSSATSTGGLLPRHLHFLQRWVDTLPPDETYVPVLQALALTGNTLPETAVQGALVGEVLGKISNSTLSLVGDAGGRVALAGNSVVRGATALDYETNTQHSFTIRETYFRASNSPRDTVLTLFVTDVTESTGQGSPVGLLLAITKAGS